MKKITKYSVSIIILLVIVSVSFPQTDQPKNAIYYNEKGWEYLAKSDHFRAIISFKNALKQNPKYKEALLGLGQAYLKTEAYDESLKLFGDVLRVDKTNIEAINGAASAMTELGRYNDAMKYFDAALKIDEDNTDAKFGTAYIFYLMDKIIWARRKLNSILIANPYHYRSLLLMADIKIRENRNDEAKNYIQKAIDANIELPDGYIKFGQVLLRDFKLTSDADYLAEAAEKFEKALAINPENLIANRSMGNLFLLKQDYNGALDYFKKTLADYPDNAISLYTIATAYAGLNDSPQTIDYLLKALKQSPSDNILISRLEDFLMLNDFAIGNPMRTKFSNDHYDTALKKLKANLPDEAIMHLNRSLLLNPLNRAARENLRDMYFVLDYYRYYIDEQKILLNQYPESKYQEMLQVAVIKRRDRMYHKAGYSSEVPQRDVPQILVLNLSPYEAFSLHPDAGEVIANYITFTLSQFGRMQPVGLQKRLEISRKLKNDRIHIADNLEIIGDLVREGTVPEPDYILFGSYREGSGFITVNMELMNFRNGVIINDFSISEGGRENLSTLSMRISKKIYDAIPYKGRVLQTNGNEIIVNLGLIDGIKPGDLLTIYKLNESPSDSLKLKKKILLEVSTADTLISSVKVRTLKDLEIIEINDTVYPLKKRRAKLIQ